MQESQQKLLSLIEQRESTSGWQLEQVELLAEGGMAYIYRARQPALNRFVVIKQLKDNQTPELINRFQREARTLAQVLHQNVAHVYDMGSSEETQYILMEFIDGVDLSTVIKKASPIPVEVAASVALGIARGLGAIHEHHLIHRDVKPSNVRLSRSGEVKLMDLGIVHDQKDGGLTRPGVLVGSRFYLSPEQVLGDEVSYTSDIFLLGICLYEMLCGTRPFKDQGTSSVFQQIRDVNYVPIRKMRSKLPRKLIAILEKCLQKDPSERFRSAKEIALALEDFLGPYRSAHGQDIIARFLDKEALVQVSAAIEEEPPKRRFKQGKLSPWLWVPVVGALLYFSFYLGQRNPITQKNLPNYKAPKSIRR